MMEGVDNTVWFTSIVLSNIKENIVLLPMLVVGNYGLLNSAHLSHTGE